MCYCQSSKSYQECCEPFHLGTASPESAEALMRSRYSAFAIKNMDYLRKTQDPQTREDFDRETNLQWAESVEFLGLEILKTEQNGNKAIVEFRAQFKELASGQESSHHELSQFRRQQGVWYFRSGKLIQNQ